MPQIKSLIYHYTDDICKEISSQIKQDSWNFLKAPSLTVKVVSGMEGSNKMTRLNVRNRLFHWWSYLFLFDEYLFRMLLILIMQRMRILVMNLLDWSHCPMFGWWLCSISLQVISIPLFYTSFWLFIYSLVISCLY